MSKRAEQAAIKAYPEMDMFRAPNPYKTQLRKERRKCFRQGYEQAEKDTIERAARWIMKLENQAEARFRITDDEFIELFRKAMEEE